MDTNYENLTDYYLLLWQSEFNNLISTKSSVDLSNQIFKSVIEGMDDVMLKNNEFMDLYLCENLFSTLLPALEALSKNVEKLMLHNNHENPKEQVRFNPCNFLAEFLMRNNPRYGKNKETHKKFLVFTRRERKTRMMKASRDNLYKKLKNIYSDFKKVLNKTNINNLVLLADQKLNLNNNLNKFDWIEKFRKYKDDEEISFDKFYEAFIDAVLDLFEITEANVKDLLS